MVMERLKLSCLHVIGVFDPQACDTGVMHVSWQYILLPLTKFDGKFSLLVHACLSHNRTINKKIASKNNLTNRSHFVMRLFSNRSQMMSKYGKNQEVARKPQAHF